MHRRPILGFLYRTVATHKTLLRNSSKGKPPAAPVESSSTEKPEFTCRYKYQPEMEVLINMQIGAEQQVAQDYLGMAVYFAHPEVARPGCRGFFTAMYEEELGHMLELVRYQLSRGGVVQLSALVAPQKNDKLSMLNAFKRALCLEHVVTEKLENIVTEASNNNDHQCADFVTSVFLEEQMRSISDISAHVTILTALTESPHGLYHYDLELLKRYPCKDNKLNCGSYIFRIFLVGTFLLKSGRLARRISYNNPSLLSVKFCVQYYNAPRGRKTP